MTIYQLIALFIFGIPGTWALIRVGLAFRFKEQPLGLISVTVLVICTIVLLITFLGLRW
jgi:hypothetical protein